MNRKHFKLDLLLVAGFLLLPFLLYGNVTLGSLTMLPADNLFQWQPWASYTADFGITQPHNHLISDLILQNYAWKQFVRDNILAGEIPLWNPYLFAGIPFLAAGQHGAYYPFSILFLILPLAKAYGWYTVSQLWLAGVFTHIFGRVLGWRRASAFLAGLVYQTCGFILVSAAVFPMILGAAIWLPLLLAGVDLIIQRATKAEGAGKTLPMVALTSLALGCQILAGHIEITYYTLLVMAGYAAWHLLPHWWHTWQTQAGRARVQASLKPALWLLSMVMIGIMLGAIQFIPFYEVGATNFREGSASFADVQSYGFPNRRLLTFVLPNFFGNPTHHTYTDLFTNEVVPLTVNAYGQSNPRGAGTSDWGIKNYVEGGIYLGILPLFLATLGVWSAWVNQKQRWHIGFFLTLSLASLAFIFGTPLYALLYYGLPGINQLHSPFRWVFPLSLSVAMLAGYGADYLSQTRNEKLRMQGNIWASDPTPSRLPKFMSLWSKPSLITVFAGISFWGGLAGLVALWASRLGYSAIEATVERLFMGFALAPDAFPNARAFFSYEWRQLFLFGLMLMATGTVLRVSRCPIYIRRRPIWLFMASVTIGLDLLIAGYGFNSAVDPALLEVEPALTQWLSAQSGEWRITTFDPHGSKPLNANGAWHSNLQDIRGYESVIPKQYTAFMSAIEPQNELQFNRVQPIMNWQSLNSPLLDLLGVKYIITPQDVSLPKLQLAWTGDGLRVYENLAVVPRAYTMPASSLALVPDPLVAMSTLDPRQYVIVAEADGKRLVANETSPATLTPATIAHYGNREVIAQTTVDDSAWLVLNDSYALGWKAFVKPLGSEADETEVPITRVNGNFRGVQLGAGSWEVRFRYSPPSFILGGLTSFMGGMILVFAGIVWAWRRFYSEEGTLTNTRSIAKNSLAPMALNIFNRLIDFVFAAFYLRLLGPGAAGSYATAITIASLHEIIANWGLNTWIIREVSQDKEQAGHYLLNTSILRIGTGVLATLPVFLYLGGRDIAGNALALQTQIALLLLIMGMIVSGMAGGLTGLFYAYEQAEVPAAITTVTTILRVGFGVGVLLAGWSFVGLAGVSILVNLITFTILLVLAMQRFALHGPWRLDWVLQKSMLHHSYPLMLNHLLATIFFFIDVPILEQIKGEEAVGWYDSAYKYVRAFNIVPSFFTIALFPVISRQIQHSIDDGRRTYRMAVKLLILVALPLAAVTTLLAPIMIGLLGGADFLPDGATALRIMIWSIPFGWINSVTNYVLIALGQERLQTRAFAIGVGFNLIANLIFIPLYSYKAAATTTILSEIILLGVFYYFLIQKMPDVEWGALLWRPLLVAGMMGVAMWLGSQAHWLIGLLVGLSVYGGGLFLLRVFGEAEWQIVQSILPASLVARLKRA